MTTWLLDTPLLKMSGLTNQTALGRWCDAERPLLFLSGASVSFIVAAIEKTPKSQPERKDGLSLWLEDVTGQFADRIHSVDTAIFKLAGAIFPKMSSGLPRYHLHDSILVATAKVYGHGLVTRRSTVFGPWTEIETTVI